MTTDTVAWNTSPRLRRATFVPSPAEATARRHVTVVTAAAVVASVAAVGVLAPLFF